MKKPPGHPVAVFFCDQQHEGRGRVEVGQLTAEAAALTFHYYRDIRDTDPQGKRRNRKDVAIVFDPETTNGGIGGWCPEHFGIFVFASTLNAAIEHYRTTGRSRDYYVTPPAVRPAPGEVGSAG